MATEVKQLQSMNASLPIDVTLFGIITEVKPVQLLKAYMPMDVTLLGMVIEVKLVQIKYLQIALYQRFTI